MVQQQKLTHILVAIARKDDIWPLLSLSYALAQTNGGRITVLQVSKVMHPPHWLTVPLAYQDIPIEIVLLAHDASPAAAIITI